MSLLSSANRPDDNPGPDWDTLVGMAGIVGDWVWEQDTGHRLIRLAGHCLEGDPAAEPDALLGYRRWELGLTPADDGMDWATHRAMLESRQPFRNLLLRRATRDGNITFVSISGMPCYDAEGHWTGYRGTGQDVTEQQLRSRTVERFQASMDASPDCIMITDLETHQIQYINDTVCELTGFSRGELLKLQPHEISGVPRDEVARLFAAAISAGPEGETAPPFLAATKDGTRKGWWEPHHRGIRIDGRWVIVTVSRQITGRVLAEQAALRANRMYATLTATNEAIMRTRTPEELFQQVCDAAVDAGKMSAAAILLADETTGALRVAASAGMGQESLRNTRISTVATVPEGHGLNGTAYRTGEPCVSNDFQKDPRTAPWHEGAKAANLKSAASIPILRGGKSVGVLFLCAGERRSFDEEILGLLCRMTENLSFALQMFEHELERKRAEERIRYMATHDALTGLPNRVLFGELLDQAVLTAHRYGHNPAVMFVDLDRFKLVNDSLGHAAGDILLKEMTQRLRSVLRASDVLARMGGDEFVILLQNVEQPSAAATVARKLLDVALEPLTIMEHECRVTASIGISLYPAHGEDQQMLMKNADTAMYLAKEKGKNAFEFYEPGMQSQSIERLELEAALRTALAKEEFHLHYQAKLDLKTNRITGVEALLRWEHPTLGPVSPQQFIPLCEETGAIVPIGRWVLKSACKQNVAWQRQGLPPIKMAVNLSARQFSDPDLINDIHGALSESGMDPTLLELELTESMVMLNPARTIEILTEIKSIGVRTALDDFGVGYSSLAQIKGFPIDTLKVDRSFIRNLPESGQDRAITQAIINMARTLSLKVVAEGVETQAQEAFLRDISCDESQGFYFSRPASPDDFARLLKGHGMTLPE
ncbi:MAG: EAL and GGDEF domain-containing protein [Marinobacter sp.]